MFALFPVYYMSFRLSPVAHGIHLHSFITCWALLTASVGLIINAGHAIPACREYAYAINLTVLYDYLCDSLYLLDTSPIWCIPLLAALS
jgi:hypothetical protein